MDNPTDKRLWHDLKRTSVTDCLQCNGVRQTEMCTMVKCMKLMVNHVLLQPIT